MPALLLVIAVIAAILTPIIAYINHIMWWIGLVMTDELDTMGELLLAIVGTFIPILGVIHGIILWF